MLQCSVLTESIGNSYVNSYIEIDENNFAMDGSVKSKTNRLPASDGERVGRDERKLGRVPRAPCICICNAAVSARVGRPAGRSDFASRQKNTFAPLISFAARTTDP